MNGTAENRSEPLDSIEPLSEKEVARAVHPKVGGVASKTLAIELSAPKARELRDFDPGF
jgi:hypothetical protein